MHRQKGVNLSMIGCICARGIISFTKVIPLKTGDAELIEKEFYSEVSVKKRKCNTEEHKIQKPLKKGTTAYHIVKYREFVMNVLDKNEMKGVFIILDNFRVYHFKFVVDTDIFTLYIYFFIYIILLIFHFIRFVLYHRQ